MMPIINVKNWPSKVAAIQWGGKKRKGLPDHDAFIMMVNDDNVIEVTGLFVRPDRTKEVRDRLAYALKECGKAHNETLGCEVLIHRFDPEEDSYARG